MIRVPREARKQGASGIYHVMLRGINLQQIFEDEEDNRKFLEVIEDGTCNPLYCYGAINYFNDFWSARRSLLVSVFDGVVYLFADFNLFDSL